MADDPISPNLEFKTTNNKKTIGGDWSQEDTQELDFGMDFEDSQAFSIFGMRAREIERQRLGEESRTFMADDIIEQSPALALRASDDEAGILNEELVDDLDIELGAEDEKLKLQVQDLLTSHVNTIKAKKDQQCAEKLQVAEREWARKHALSTAVCKDSTSSWTKSDTIYEDLVVRPKAQDRDFGELLDEIERLATEIGRVEQENKAELVKLHAWADSEIAKAREIVAECEAVDVEERANALCETMILESYASLQDKESKIQEQDTKIQLLAEVLAAANMSDIANKIVHGNTPKGSNAPAHAIPPTPSTMVPFTVEEVIIPNDTLTRRSKGGRGGSRGSAGRGGRDGRGLLPQ